MNHIVLLGDSIFDNGAYVDRGPDVIKQLRSILPHDWKATLLALDGSLTTDVIDQAARIPASATHLIVAAQGAVGTRLEVASPAEPSVTHRLASKPARRRKAGRDDQMDLQGSLARPTAFRRLASHDGGVRHRAITGGHMLTLSAWVSAKGLDREFDSLCMCDGFDSGKIHWQIRSDGALDLGVQGARPNQVEIFGSPAVIGFNQFGQWIHLAVVVDGRNQQVIHYVNGTPVSRHALHRPPPYRIGPEELGNWNPGDSPNKPPFMIRHFSGAVEEFALYNRALSDAEIRALHSEGKPQPDL